MNYHFGAVYTLIFLSGIIGSFIALKASISYWADYEIFMIESNGLASFLEISDYFDAYLDTLNFSSSLSIDSDESIIIISRNDFFSSFNNSSGINEQGLLEKNFTIIKNVYGADLS